MSSNFNLKVVTDARSTCYDRSSLITSQWLSLEEQPWRLPTMKEYVSIGGGNRLATVQEQTLGIILGMDDRGCKVSRIRQPRERHETTTRKPRGWLEASARYSLWFLIGPCKINAVYSHLSRFCRLRFRPKHSFTSLFKISYPLQIYPIPPLLPSSHCHQSILFTKFPPLLCKDPQQNQKEIPWSKGTTQNGLRNTALWS